MSDGDLEAPVQTALSSPPAASATKKQKFDYNDHLKQEFNGIIDLLTLTDVQKAFLRSRWLDQLLWMEGRAATTRNWHRYLQLTTIIGGVIVPALVSLSLGTLNPAGFSIPNTEEAAKNSQFRGWIGLSAFVLSQVVAISAASDQFFKNGDRWRHYRRSAESLKTQGWQFFQLSGPYATYAKSGGHKDAFLVFASNVEEIIQRDVEVYSTQVVQERKKDDDKDTSEVVN